MGREAMRDSPPMTRRNFVRVGPVLAGTILAGGSVGRSEPAPAQAQTREPQESVKEAIGDTVAIGFLAALSGPDGGWGQPGLTGNQIFIDRVNADGGLLVSEVRSPLKLYVFDDEAIASKALQGARELVLEHNVKFISAIGGAPADAVHPFLTEKESCLRQPDLDGYQARQTLLDRRRGRYASNRYAEAVVSQLQ
jgi:branched-chain amino acid transport system substrate-binding protein